MSWSVTYANMRGRREDPLAQIAEMLQDDLDRQTPLYPAAVPTRPLVHPSRPMAPPFPPPGGDCASLPFIYSAISNFHFFKPQEQSRSTAVVTPRSATPSDYPPCIICGEPAKHVCGRCKIRYCSSTCQYNDWPNHQARCIPPPYVLKNVFFLKLLHYHSALLQRFGARVALCWRTTQEGSSSCYLD